LHEYAITESILEIVQTEASQAGAIRVDEVKVVIGELSSFAGSSIEFYFEELSHGTVAEGARLVFEELEANAICCSCGSGFRPRNAFYSCPECGSRLFDLKQGQELYIDSIEVT
jgi:hydrogenase nickel incorporation protein HypA/HybF